MATRPDEGAAAAAAAASAAEAYHASEDPVEVNYHPDEEDDEVVEEAEEVEEEEMDFEGAADGGVGGGSAGAGEEEEEDCHLHRYPDEEEDRSDSASTGTPTLSNTARAAAARQQKQQQQQKKKKKHKQSSSSRDASAAAAAAASSAASSSAMSSSSSAAASTSWFEGTLLSMGLLDHTPALSFSPTDDSGSSRDDFSGSRSKFEQASPESLILSSVTSSLQNPISPPILARAAAAAAATASSASVSPSSPKRAAVDGTPSATASPPDAVAFAAAVAPSPPQSTQHSPEASPAAPTAISDPALLAGHVPAAEPTAAAAMSLREIQESSHRWTAQTEQMRAEFAAQLASLQLQLQQTNELLRASKNPAGGSAVAGGAAAAPAGNSEATRTAEPLSTNDAEEDPAAPSSSPSSSDANDDELVQANAAGKPRDVDPKDSNVLPPLPATRDRNVEDSSIEDDKKQDDDDWMSPARHGRGGTDGIHSGPTNGSTDADPELAIAWLQNELRHRDHAQAQTNRLLEQSQEVIHDLRGQMLEYAGQVSELAAQLRHQQVSACERDELRSQEAEDLRVLNDAIEQELHGLRSKLEEAVREAEAREAEVSQHASELQRANYRIGELEVQLGEAETRLNSRSVVSPEHPSSPLVRMAPLRLYDDEDDEINGRVPHSTVQQLQEQLAESEDRTRQALEQLAEAQRMLQESEASKEQAVSSFQSQLSQFRQASAHSEAVLRDQLADMEVELAGLRLQGTKSGDSLLDDGTRDSEHPDDEPQSKASRDLESSSSSVLQALQELQNRLEDRDATISALVKSSASLEQQLASAQLEAEALRSKFMQPGGHGDSAGLDVIVANSVSMERVSELEHTVETLQRKEQDWAQDLNRLQTELQDNIVEVAQLKSRLEATKSENLLLKAQLDHGETGSDGGSITNSSVISSSLQAQIQERDCAIANLVQQSIEQDRLVSDLRSKLSSLQQQAQASKSAPRGIQDVELSASDVSAKGSSEQMTWEEIQELRRETEMFAGQVIEQDEEIEALTLTLKAKDLQLAALEREIASLRKAKARAADASVVDRLNGEIDELTEANNVLRDEVRMLRRKSKDMESSSEEIDRLKREVQQKAKEADEFKETADNLSKEKADLARAVEELRATSSEEVKQQLERVQAEASATIRNLESRLRENDRTIVSLRAASSMARSATMDELELENLRSEVVSLQRNLQHQIAAVDSAKNTIRELEQMLAQRNANEAAAWEDEKEELLAEIESLSTQLDEARADLKKVEEQRCIIEDFKAKLEDADEAREASEKSIVDTYERKLSLLTLDKDVTIDKLRKELAETKASCDEKLDSHLREIDTCKERLSEASEQMSYEIQDREARIFALERTLEAQEQLVNNMKSEMDILQGSMENKAVTRREELEVMQQELVDLTTLAAQQERDIRSLQGKLQDQKVDYETQIGRLKETIALMESDDQADHRTAADLKMEIRVREVKERLEKLKWRNTSLSEENALLRERLIRAEEASVREKSADDETKELQRLLAERDLKMQMLDAELKELKYNAQQTMSPPPPPPPESESSPELSSPKTSALCKSPLRSSSSSSSKPPPSSRRLGFLGRRSSSARRPSQVP